MPGSVSSFQNIGPSSSLIKNVDTRTCCKKVSFNKDVRINQYPDEDDSVPQSQRFWFKVYKSFPNTRETTWKRNASNNWTTEDRLNSLRTIVGTNVQSEMNFPNYLELNRPQQSINGFSKIYPKDPPIDYTEDDTIYNSIHFKSKRTEHKNNPEQKNHMLKGSIKQGALTLNDKPMLHYVKTHDFQKPTISSTAKCNIDNNTKLFANDENCTKTTKYSTRNKTDNSIKVNKYTNQKVRSSHREQSEEEKIIRADKCISTNDSFQGLKENTHRSNVFEENSRLNKTKNDKSTQMSGTLAKFQERKLNSSAVPINNKYRKPLLSSCYIQKNLPHSGLSEIIPEEIKFNKLNERNSDKYFETLRNDNHLNSVNNKNLQDKNCSQKNKYKSIAKCEELVESAININALNNLSLELQNEKTLFKDQQNNLSPINSKINETSLERLNFIHPSLNSNSVHERLFKTQSVLNYPQNSCDFLDKTKDTNRIGSYMPVRSSQRSASCEREHKCIKDNHSVIDWSLSGFHLGNDNKMSMSLDGVSIVHHRTPLLMYIPGVSHHNCPALEDDQLSVISGLSRSENDIVRGSEFKRRHSMPRSNKFNWLRSRSNKMHLKH